jgi:hypothetical protein
MLETYELFVRGNCKYSDLVDTIQRITGEIFKKSTEHNETCYEREYKGIYISIYENSDFEDDRDMIFSKYCFYASFGTYGAVMEDGEDGHQACKNLAIQTGRVLCDTHSCECMVLKNFEKIDQLIVSGSKVDQPSNGKDKNTLAPDGF